MSFQKFPRQQQVVELLQRSLARNRLAHGYLFTGEALDELEAVALTLARTLNCRNPVTGEGGAAIDCCDECLSCRKIDRGNYPDLHILRPESKMRILRVEQLRDLMREMNLKPSEAQFKVGVIVAADRMNTESANAFLKTLEEPPERSILILLSTEPQRLLETIVSRCLRLTFAGGARRELPPEEAEWLASFSGMAAERKHGLLNRYQLLGNLLERLGALRERIETVQTGKSPLQHHDDVEDRLRKKWEDELKASIEAEYRHQRAQVLANVQWWLRDIWIWTQAQADDLLCFGDLSSAVKTIGQRVTAEDAQHNLQVIEETQRLLHTNVQEALALEVGLLKLRFG